MQQLLHGELAIQHRNHHAAVRDRQGAVHHQQVTVENAASAHRVTRYAHEEGALAMLDQMLVETEMLFHIVIGRGGEAGGYGTAQQGMLPIKQFLVGAGQRQQAMRGARDLPICRLAMNSGLHRDHFRYLRIKPTNTPNISRIPCGRMTG